MFYSEYNIEEMQKPSIIIYTEGKNTEPFYFEKLQKLCLNSIVIKVIPCGKSTLAVIEDAKNDFTDKYGNVLKDDKGVLFKKKSDNTLYNQVWCVFDEDNFKGKFNDAIHKAKSLGFNIGISNKCFELWLYLHFHLQQECKSNDDYKRLLTECNNIKYDKERDIAKEFFDKLITNDIFQYTKLATTAIKNSFTLMKNRADDKKLSHTNNLCMTCGDAVCSCHKCCPYTTVHHLIMVILYYYLDDRLQKETKKIFPKLFS